MIVTGSGPELPYGMNSTAVNSRAGRPVARIIPPARQIKTVLPSASMPSIAISSARFLSAPGGDSLPEQLPDDRRVETRQIPHSQFRHL